MNRNDNECIYITHMHSQIDKNKKQDRNDNDSPKTKMIKCFCLFFVLCIYSHSRLYS